MELDRLVKSYPQVYHMAELGSWPSIRKLGLLSTSALLDLFEIGGAERFSLESQWRPQSVTISHPIYGSAVIRDQGPMPENELQGLLIGMEPREWYELINGKTFFWADMYGLRKLLGAVRYRNKAHDVLTVDTRLLLERHMSRITLTDQNSGSTISKRPRGRETFRSVGEFDQRFVKEVAVEYSVPDAASLTRKVEEWKGAQVIRRIWPS